MEQTGSKEGASEVTMKVRIVKQQMVLTPERVEEIIAVEEILKMRSNGSVLHGRLIRHDVEGCIDCLSFDVSHGRKHDTRLPHKGRPH